jgi:RHS repeat-associated protein
LYAYNFENWLIRVEIQKADKIKIVTFAYDPFGRRLSKTVLKQEIEDEDDEEGEPDEDEVEVPRSIFYVYDNEDIVLEYNHNGKLKARYTHGPGIDEPLAIEKKKDTFFYHADGLGSVVALTDAKQKVVETYDYDSFGNFKRKGGKAKNAYAFTGREWNREIGLYYYRARYYDAATGRFLAFDPILRGVQHTESNSCRQAVDSFPVQSPQELNQYVYVVNDPVNQRDPFGLALFIPRRGNGNYKPGFTPQDQICTVPPAFGFLDTNPCTRKCCQEHDDCYTKYGCNASSWWGNLLLYPGICQLCNAKALICVLGNLGRSTSCDCET